MKDQEQSGTVNIKKTSHRELSRIIEFDRKIFGADRSTVFRHLHSRQPDFSLVAIDQRGEIDGYIFAREGAHAFHIGPVIAKSVETAIALVDRHLTQISGPTYLDAMELHDEFLNWLKINGFLMQRSFTRMIRADIKTFDQPDSIFAAAGPELG